jgi:hypothetical protein
MFIQIIANIILLWVVVSSSIKFKLKVTIHNLPIIILFGSLILLFNYFCLASVIKYLIVGFFISSINLVISSIEIEGKPSMNSVEKTILSLLTLIFWSQLIILMAFYILNYKKMIEHESL